MNNNTNDWKESLLADAAEWLDGITEDDWAIAQEAAAEATEDPSLAQFYAQLTAANAEFKRSSRRTTDAVKQFGDVMSSLQEEVERLRNTAAQQSSKGPGKENQVSRDTCLSLVEMVDRFQRVGKALANPPTIKTTSFFNKSAETQAQWGAAWETQRTAVDIVGDHAKALLDKLGVTRIDTVGLSFDPLTMTAIAVVKEASRPDFLVAEEILPGWRLGDTVLRPAQVSVYRQS